MRTVFISQNEMGQACLSKLFDIGADIRRVITKPSDSHISDQVDFHSLCHTHGVPVTETASANDSEVVDVISACEPDLLFVIGWSELVSSTVLDIPSVASIGMHPAPLPRGRGRAPLAWSLIKGLDETALTMFHLVEAADAGDIVAQEPLPISITDDAESMYEKMVAAGEDLIAQYYPLFLEGTAPRTPQNDDEATWWPKRVPQYGIVDWTEPPRRVYDWIRGQTRPYPGAFSYLDEQKVTFWAANSPRDNNAFVRPGEIVSITSGAVTVGVWEGVIEITELQVGNDEPVSPSEFAQKYPFEVGSSFCNARDLRQ